MKTVRNLAVFFRGTLGAVLVLLVMLTGCYPPSLDGSAHVSPTPEPLIPTVLPSTRIVAIAPSPSLPATRVPKSTQAAATPPSATSAALSQPFVLGDSPRSRVCVAVPGPDVALKDFDWQGAAPGWWLNWNVLSQPPAGVPFAQMVRVPAGELHPAPAILQATARHNPGALWLIGNEMDVAWQDNATPDQYAQAYAAAYTAIKTGDPTAQVAIGGVSQPTPLRLAYLDQVLAAYRKQTGAAMPVDMWNVHAFVLREERDSWGVGIPPGLSEDQGLLREIAEHADLALFEAQIMAFREWMAARGFRNKPLIVSEYGVLMPAEYGFPPETVIGFMKATFDFFLSAVDAKTGYPADDDRLVQAFCWYSAADPVYATSNLFDPDTRAPTPLGEAYHEYMLALPQ